MKLTDRKRSIIRLMLWAGGVTWSLLFFTYAMILLPAFRLILEFYYGSGFPVWMFSVFYVITTIVAVVVFFWFFGYLLKKTRK